MKIKFNPRRPSRWLAGAVRRALGLRNEEGGALLEMAVTLPLLMTVITGAASFSMAFYSLQQLGNATASAVQAVAAEQGLLTDPCQQVIIPTIQASLPGWAISKFSFSLTVTGANNTAYAPMTGSGSSWTCGASTNSQYEAPNEPVSLTVTYNYSWLPIVAFSPSSPLSVTEAAMAD
jgi:Flp pilus assembly protein TadG